MTTDSAAAADAAGAPLSQLARLLMRHETTLKLDAPRWLADRAVCASRGWSVATGVGAAWLLAEGTQRLLAAERTDRRLTDRLCAGLAGGDGHKNRRTLRAETPGGGLRVALGLLAMRTGASRQDIAVVALAWGALRLHPISDGHDCAAAAPSGTAAQVATPAADRAPVCPHTAAVHGRGAADTTDAGAVRSEPDRSDVAARVARRLAGMHRRALAHPAIDGGRVAARGRRRPPAHTRSPPRYRLAERLDPLGDPHQRHHRTAATHRESQRIAESIAWAVGVMLRRHPNRHRRNRRCCRS